MLTEPANVQNVPVSLGIHKFCTSRERNRTPSLRDCCIKSSIIWVTRMQLNIDFAELWPQISQDEATGEVREVRVHVTVTRRTAPWGPGNKGFRTKSPHPSPTATRPILRKCRAPQPRHSSKTRCRQNQRTSEMPLLAEAITSFARRLNASEQQVCGTVASNRHQDGSPGYSCKSTLRNCGHKAHKKKRTRRFGKREIA